MRRKKTFIACGSIILTVAAFLISNANKKWAATASAYFRTTTTSAFLTLFKGQTGGASMHITTAFNGHTLFIRTIGMSVDVPLFATKGTSTRLFYK